MRVSPHPAISGQADGDERRHRRPGTRLLRCRARAEAFDRSCRLLCPLPADVATVDPHHDAGDDEHRRAESDDDPQDLAGPPGEAPRNGSDSPTRRGRAARRRSRRVVDLDDGPGVLVDVDADRALAAEHPEQRTVDRCRSPRTVFTGLPCDDTTSSMSTAPSCSATARAASRPMAGRPADGSDVTRASGWSS